MSPRAETLAARLDSWAAAAPGAGFLLTPEGTLRRSEVRWRILQLAGRFLREGVHPGDRLALNLRHDGESMLAVLALLGLGVSVALGDEGASGLPSVDPDPAVPPAVLPDLPATAQALVDSTSGSGGNPRRVRVSHGSLLFTAAASAARLPRRRPLTLMRYSPLLDRPAVGTVLTAMAAGARVAVTPAGLAPEALRALGVDVLRATPSTFARLRREVGGEGGAAARRLREALGGRVRWGLSSGAPLGRDLASWWKSHGVPVLERYGSRETGILAGHSPREHRLGTVGRPMPGVEVRISPEGEILTRTPGIMLGYEGGQAPPEWWPTGDLGRLRRDGHLEVLGRKADEIVTSRGRKFQPGPLEDRLRGTWPLSWLLLLGAGRPRLWGLVGVLPGAPRGEVAALLLDALEAIPASHRPRTLAAVEFSGVLPDKGNRGRAEAGLGWLADLLEDGARSGGPLLRWLEEEEARRVRDVLGVS